MEFARHAATGCRFRVLAHVVCQSKQSGNFDIRHKKLLLSLANIMFDTFRGIVVAIFGSHLGLLLVCHVASAHYSQINSTTSNDLNMNGDSQPSSFLECWEKVRRQGPSALVEPRDQILFVVVLMLSFEMLDFASKNSGSTS